MMPSDANADDDAGKTMTILRIYTGADNRSHFEDVEIPLKSAGKIGFLSELMQATGIVFRETGADYNYHFHTAPRRHPARRRHDRRGPHQPRGRRQATQVAVHHTRLGRFRRSAGR